MSNLWMDLDPPVLRSKVKISKKCSLGYLKGKTKHEFGQTQPKEKDRTGKFLKTGYIGKWSDKVFTLFDNGGTRCIVFRIRGSGPSLR